MGVMGHLGHSSTVCGVIVLHHSTTTLPSLYPSPPPSVYPQMSGWSCRCRGAVRSLSGGLLWSSVRRPPALPAPWLCPHWVSRSALAPCAVIKAAPQPVLSRLMRVSLAIEINSPGCPETHPDNVEWGKKRRKKRNLVTVI